MNIPDAIRANNELAATHDFQTFEIKGQTVRFGKCRVCGAAPYGIRAACPGKPEKSGCPRC